MQRYLFLPIFLLLAQATAHAQPADGILTLPAALRIAVTNYPQIKAAQHMANASALELKAAKQDGLPDFTAGIQLA
ncbi:MAG TPA: TolC family protein, partial [Puia sp.]|nr:TolC family protein [Puia sp.]